MKLTLGVVRPVIARVLGKCTDSPEVIPYVNEAQQRLLPRGRWVGKIQRYRVCVDEACLTWPRQIETIEAYWICDCPGTLRDMWFENIVGMYNEDGCGQGMVDRGEGYVTYRDVNHTTTQPKLLKVQASVAEESTASIIVLGYDENSQWIQTVQEGVLADGEVLSLETGAATSVNYFSAITGIIKTETNGLIRLYEYDPSTSLMVALGQYEPDETHPNYRRSFVPGLADHPACCSTDTECDSKAVTVLATLRHMPVARDNDFLVLRNLAALKLMVMALKKEEKDLFTEARAYEAAAVVELQHELLSHEGAGVVKVPRFQSSDVWGGGAIVNYV